MDPLAEMTPWKSPYSYAGNNFINKTDYMGLFEDYPTNPDGSPCYDCPSPYEFVHNNDDEWNAFNKDGSLNEDWWKEHGGGFGGSGGELHLFELDPNITWRNWHINIPNTSLFGPGVQVLEWVALDALGNVVGWGDDNDDWHVYRVDRNWDGTYEGLEGHSKIIGWEVMDDYGNKPRYTKGQPTYWLGQVQTSSYINGQTYIIASKALMYGNQMVDISNTIDSNLEAILHYYFGGGRAIQNGKTANALFTFTPEFRSIFHEIANGSTHGIVQVEMQGYMFHIGTTSCTYHVNGSMVVIAFALHDSFSDPNYKKEEKYKEKGIDLTDGLGPNLELGGTPYNYIPTVFVIRR